MALMCLRDTFLFCPPYHCGHLAHSLHIHSQEAAIAEKTDHAHSHHIADIGGVDERFDAVARELGAAFPPMVSALQQSTQQALNTLQVRARARV
jgi:hypothetical protein